MMDISMNMNEIVGWIAALLSSISLVPQVVKGFKTKSVADISIIMLTVMLIAAVCWEMYGIYRDDWVIITTNICALVFLLILFVQKLLLYRAKN